MRHQQYAGAAESLLEIPHHPGYPLHHLVDALDVVVPAIGIERILQPDLFVAAVGG